MAITSKRIWGWFFFDWASQPYNTLLADLHLWPLCGQGDGRRNRSARGLGLWHRCCGRVDCHLLALLGAIADRAGKRMPFIKVFSLMYVVGAGRFGLRHRINFNLWLVMTFFGIGMIGMEFATTFTNAMLPDLGTKDEIGRISGSGWAFGYVGGVVSLIIMLTLFAEGATGKTLIGHCADFRVGCHTVGRHASGGADYGALVCGVYDPVFSLGERTTQGQVSPACRVAVRDGMAELQSTIASLPQRSSLFAYLVSSMFYRDALNGMYVFGGIYAAGILGWQPTDVGMFGIMAAISGAIFAWLGGHADSRFGPKPVIVTCVLILTMVAIGVVMVSRDSVFGFAVPPGSALPDIAFYGLGFFIGAAGGALQSASRTMMVRQSDPDKMTEAFGLYALAGKATSFMAPLLIGITTDLSGSQRIGVTPLIGLFLIGSDSANLGETQW